MASPLPQFHHAAILRRLVIRASTPKHAVENQGKNGKTGRKNGDILNCKREQTASADVGGHSAWPELTATLAPNALELHRYGRKQKTPLPVRGEGHRGRSEITRHSLDHFPPVIPLQCPCRMYTLTPARNARTSWKDCTEAGSGGQGDGAGAEMVTFAGCVCPSGGDPP